MSDPIRPTDFPLVTTCRLRYADTDRQGHVNNAVFAEMLEVGRTELLYDPASPLAAPGCAFVIARLTLDFRAELTWPGDVVIGTKVASLGLRIRQGRSYHGLSLNVDMDLEPFARINPCGYPGLRVTQLRDLGIDLSLDAAVGALLLKLGRQLGYTHFGDAEEGLPVPP